jgi:hypothetical protein
MKSFRHRELVQIVVAPMILVAVASCGSAAPDRPQVSLKAPASTTSQTTLFNELAIRAPATTPTQRDVPVSASIASSLEEVDQQPNPQVRMAALEVWAAAPSESLDPVTYALVDPDEAVRARAQELLEQELVRR